MPRPRKPPHLAIRKERRKDGTLQRVWVIRDGQRYQRTGCTEAQVEPAKQALSVFLADSFRPNTSERRASAVKLATVLMLYLDLKEKTIARPAELRARVRQLNNFWGNRVAGDIRGPLCRDYIAQRGAVIAGRRELETLRAAVNYYAREYGLDTTPKFTLPENSKPRERWLTRSEAARLLWAAYRSPYHKHLVRFILIGLYTGTRHKAILSLQWMPNTTGGWVDVSRGVLYRRAAGERETKKRQPPARIPPRLLAHVRRWQAHDSRPAGHIVTYAGAPIIRIEKAFRSVRRRAALDVGVTPHILRHTRATWLMQAGVDMWEAAGSLGMTVETLQNVYGHHSPDWQKRAAEAY